MALGDQVTRKRESEPRETNMTGNGVAATVGGVVASAIVWLLAGGPPAAASTPGQAPVLEGRVLGNEAGQGVWIGLVGRVAETHSWTFVEGDEFKVDLPADEPISLVAVAKDRVPLLLPVTNAERRGGVELRLARGEALTVQVRSDDGAPLSNVRVVAVPETRAVFNALAREQFATSLRDVTIDLGRDGQTAQVPPFAWPVWNTDRDGTVRIAGLGAGSHLVQATLDGHVRVVRAVDVGDDAPNSLDIPLSKEYFVAGEVVGVDGLAASGVEVSASWYQHKGVDMPSPDGSLSSRAVLRHTVVATDDAGAFRVGPFEGETNVTLFATSSAAGSSVRQEVLVPSEGVELRLQRHSVRGQVVDSATGEPLARFRVVPQGPHPPALPLTRPDPKWIAYPDGRFDVLVEPMAVSVRIDAPEYIPHFARVRTDQAGQHDLGEIALDRERSITGRVRDAKTRQPVAGARVGRSASQYQDRALRTAASNWFVGVETDADGKFALGASSTRADVLEAKARGRLQLVELPADSAHVEIEMSFGEGVIAGSLLSRDGSPATGVVDLNASGWSYPLEQEVGDDGAFRWEGLEGGEYRIGAASFDGVVEARVVTVQDGDLVDGVVLTVDPAGRLTGSISGLFRTEFVTLEVRERDGRFATQRTFRNGPFAMQGIPDAFTVKAETSTGRSLALRSYLSEQGEARMNLDFSGRSRLTGIVSAGGRALAGVRLAAMPEDRSRPVVYTRTNDLGRYAAVGISNGPHSVATDTGRSFPVAVAGSTNLDIELPPNELSGTVRAEAAGHPAAGAWVRLSRPEGDAPAVALRRQVASDGGFRFAGLDAGEYLVRVSHRDFAEVSRRVAVAGRQTLLFQLKRPSP